MTTESAPAPRAAQARAVQRPAATIHPPRRAFDGEAAALGPRSIDGRGPVLALLAADVLAVALTAGLLLPRLPWPPVVLGLLAVLQPAAQACRGLYRPSLSPSALTELPTVGALALVQWIAVAEALTAYSGGYATGWTTLACAVVAQTALCCGARSLVYRFRRWTAVRRPQSALVVGGGPLVQQVVHALYEHAEYGMRPVGQVAPRRTPAQGGAGPLPVLVSRQDVTRAVIQNSVRHAVFTTEPNCDAETSALVPLLTEHGCRLWLVDGGAAAGSPAYRAAGHDHLWGFSAQPLNAGLHRPVALAVKRVVDIVLAAIALLVAAPVMAVCALAVRFADGPGVIFRQERIGLDGRPFVLLKFRTLRPADEHESATRWSVARDRRMSFTGTVLRKSSLDELPQLWNVLRGDMSLVGPRPERPYFVATFSRIHPGYQARHRMPVGITGLAQINGLRGDTSIEERARFDNHYIDTWTPWQDVCILARTAVSLFRLGGS
ncbi:MULTISPECIES: exopolysaccharide biosynthesis polyprenyl glycosylphosphotransferase [unclassified Streptomyces]|uniref:exopolysaccharide biosynthesis polyprenyl glycosylphosphotransferase n=1 Tax=unclassified Streptomyces TaxID=2593676 RepID=UPI0033243A45